MVNRKSQRLIAVTTGYLGGIWGILTMPTEMPWWTATDFFVRWGAYIALTSAYLICCAAVLLAPSAFPNRKLTVGSDTAQRKNECA